MRKQLTHFDIYDIFTFPDDGDLCRFHKFKLTKEEFLKGDFFGSDTLPVKKYLLYLLMPINNEVTMNELATLFEIFGQISCLQEILWGCSSDDEIIYYEVFLIKTY